MKVGNTPIYLISGQEPQLEKYSEHLKSREKARDLNNALQTDNNQEALEKHKTHIAVITEWAKKEGLVGTDTT